jgi:signal transduction histidine kinase
MNNRMIRNLIFLILSILCLHISTIKVYAQEEIEISADKKIENLLEEINQLGSDSLKIDRYISAGWEYHNTEVGTSLLLATKAEELAESTNNRLGLTKAKSLKAVCESIKGANRLSNSYNEEALAIALELNDTLLISRIYNCMAINYAEDSRTYEKAYEYYKKTLQYNSDDTVGYINTHANIASLFRKMGLKDNQLKAINEVIKTTNNSKNNSRQEINLEFRIRLLTTTGDTIQANKLLDQLIEKNTKEGKNYRIIFNYLDKSEILHSQKKYSEALSILNKCSNVIDKYGYQKEADEVSYQKALIYIDMKEYNNAIKQLLSINETQDTYKNAIEKLYEAYEKDGNYKTALNYAKKYKTLTDSLSSSEAAATIAELETMYNTEKQEKENQNLKLKSIEIESQLENKNLLLEYLLAGLGIMVLLAMFFYNQNRQRKEYNELLSKEVNEKTNSLKIANKNLTETNKELEAFTYVAAHDLMTPLRSITTFTGLLKKKSKVDIDEKTAEYFSHIEKSSKWMSDLIEDLLIFTKLEKESYNFENVKVSTIIEDVKSHLQSQIKLKNAVINLNSNTKEIQVDNKKIKQLLQNIISNAIKYSKEDIQAIVDIDITKMEKFTQFKIKDNGIGIEKKYHEVIFDPFKRLHSKDQIEGTGIGLYICKKIVTNIGGTIKLESSTDGTTFYITLPHEPTIQ